MFKREWHAFDTDYNTEITSNCSGVKAWELSLLDPKDAVTLSDIIQ